MAEIHDDQQNQERSDGYAGSVLVSHRERELDYDSIKKKSGKDGFFASFFDNPIFLYEIRRMVRSRTVLASLCLYLFCMAAFHLYTFSEARINGAGADLGKTLAVGTLCLAFIMTNILLWAFSSTMTIDEGWDELIRITSINAKQAMRGKLAVSVLFTSLFHAVTLPFLTVAWLLRGVDLFLIGLFLLLFFGMTQVLNLYLVAGLVQCRNIAAVVWSTFGLIIAAIPLGAIGVLCPIMICVLADEENGGMGVTEIQAIVSVYLLLLPIGFSAGSSLLASNWVTRSNDQRVFMTGIVAWVLVFTCSALGHLALSVML